MKLKIEVVECSGKENMLGRQVRQRHPPAHGGAGGGRRGRLDLGLGF